MTPAEGTAEAVWSEKVVIKYGERTLKGYLEHPAWGSIEDLLSNAPLNSPRKFRVRILDTDVVEEIQTSEIKAVFYVNSFEGRPRHTDLHFHSRTPTVPGIWVRLKFIDGEIMEGIVANSVRYLLDPGFFLRPTDPDSNNKLVYVVKSWLIDHRVLGVRKL